MVVVVVVGVVGVKEEGRGHPCRDPKTYMHPQVEPSNF